MRNLKKKLYITFGFLAVALAIVGVFIPGLPTVPFLLVALFCFERSSKKYHDMIMNNKYFGPVLQDYYSGKGLTSSVKIKYTIFILWNDFFYLQNSKSTCKNRISYCLAWSSYSYYSFKNKKDQK